MRRTQIRPSLCLIIPALQASVKALVSVKRPKMPGKPSSLTRRGEMSMALLRSIRQQVMHQVSLECILLPPIRLNRVSSWATKLDKKLESERRQPIWLL